MKTLQFTLTALFFCIYNISYGQLTFSEKSEKEKNSVNQYENNTLFTASNDIINVAGKWTGTEIRYDRTKSFIVSKYALTFEFNQQGNKIEGTSLVQNDNGDYGKIKLRGFVIGNKVLFEEYEIMDEKVTQEHIVRRTTTYSDAKSSQPIHDFIETERVSWCFKTGELDFTRENNQLTLVGIVDSYSSKNYSACEQAYAALSKSTSTATSDSISPISNITMQNQDKKTIDNYMMNNITILKAFPVPFKDKVTIEYKIKEAGNISLTIFDLSGKLISTVFTGYKDASTYQVEVNSEQLGNVAGTYVARLTTGNNVYSKTFVKTK